MVHILGHSCQQDTEMTGFHLQYGTHCVLFKPSQTYKNTTSEAQGSALWISDNVMGVKFTRLGFLGKNAIKIYSDHSIQSLPAYTRHIS